MEIGKSRESEPGEGPAIVRLDAWSKSEGELILRYEEETLGVISGVLKRESVSLLIRGEGVLPHRAGTERKIFDHGGASLVLIAI